MIFHDSYNITNLAINCIMAKADKTHTFKNPTMNGGDMYLG